jgi:hypothetical protein
MPKTTLYDMLREIAEDDGVELCTRERAKDILALEPKRIKDEQKPSPRERSRAPRSAGAR